MTANQARRSFLTSLVLIGTAGVARGTPAPVANNTDRRFLKDLYRELKI